MLMNLKFRNLELFLCPLCPSLSLVLASFLIDRWREPHLG